MKIKILLASVALAAVAHAADVSEVASTRSVDSFPAFSSAGRVNLVAAHSMLSVHSPDGTPRQDELLVLLDPTSGKYLWEHDIVLREDEGSAKYFRDRLSTFNSALYADKDGIAWFFFGARISWCGAHPAKPGAWMPPTIRRFTSYRRIGSIISNARANSEKRRKFGS